MFCSCLSATVEHQLALLMMARSAAPHILPHILYLVEMDMLDNTAVRSLTP